MRQLALLALFALLGGCPTPGDDDDTTGADDDDSTATDDDDTLAADDDDSSSQDDDDAAIDDDDAVIDDDDAGDDDDSAPVTCADATAALAVEMYAEIGACTATVRLDHESLEILGFALLCGPYSYADEATARATAQLDTGYGQGGTLLGPGNPEDQYVFWEAPGDFGGAAVVSVRTGLTSFGGSIVWDGMGAITYPTSWRSPAELASGCPAVTPTNITTGYDLVTGGALVAGDVAAALAVVEDTALPAAFWQGGYVFDAVVVRYPPSVGVFDPGVAEWIVLLDGGWLE